MQALTPMQSSDRVVIEVGPYAGQLATVLTQMSESPSMQGVFKVQLDAGPVSYCSGTGLKKFEPAQVVISAVPRLLELLQVSLATLRHMKDKDKEFNIQELIAEAAELGIDVEV